jgi:hypothetical protein
MLTRLRSLSPWRGLGVALAASVVAVVSCSSAGNGATSTTGCADCAGGAASTAGGLVTSGNMTSAGGNASTSAASMSTSAASGGASASSGGPVSGALVPRVVAYVNCLCGFGVGLSGNACLGDPDPNVNHVKAWEDAGKSPITNYVISFASFKGSEIQTDPGAIWQSGGGSTTDFALQTSFAEAMKSAKARGKKIMLSIGGEVGSSGFLAWWSGSGGSSPERVQGMRTKLAAVAQLFAQQNGITLDGFDIDIELGGVYALTSDKYLATRDLINAVPDDLLVAFVPQIGNGLCAAPVQGDPLTPLQVLGGQCSQPVDGDDTPWALAHLDKDCLKTDGTPKLDYFGIQYYNSGTALCCGGGGDDAEMITSTFQSYKNLANGWPASGDTTDANNPWHAWAYYPGPWAAFAGIGADRLVLGKPGCKGCAGSDYLDLAGMGQVLSQLDHKLTKTMGGVLFWDLCRLFGDVGPQCVSGACQPSWGGAGVLDNLTTLKAQMDALHPQ